MMHTRQLSEKISGMIPLSGMKNKPALLRWMLNILPFLALISVSACSLATGQLTPSENVDPIYTHGAETMIARMTQDAGSTAIAYLTNIAIQTNSASSKTPTQTLSPEPPQLLPTDTLPPPTFTPTPQPPTATAIPCDLAQFLMDITIPLDTNLPIGARFTKIWRIQNIGSCTWTGDYAIIFASGNSLGSITVFSLAAVVPPGGVTDIAISLTAPATPGIYEGFWMLRSPSGSIFGTGISGNIPLPVRIRAEQISTGNYVYDFSVNYCAAIWRSPVGIQPCPGNLQDVNGSVTLINQPTIETGTRYAVGLLTRPYQAATGWISGQFPTYAVRDQDHFLAEIGCLIGSQGCDVSFKLDFLSPNGQLTNLGGWREYYDGLTTQIDIDLSVLAGKIGQFIFTVTNNANPAFSDALWIAPRIQNLPANATQILTWTNEGRNTTTCYILHIYLLSQNNAEARVFTCGTQQVEIGRTTLKNDEVTELRLWAQRLASFKAEYYQATQEGTPVISWIEFNGSGVQNASDQDIQEINNFAAKLFSRVIDYQ